MERTAQTQCVGPCRGTPAHPHHHTTSPDNTLQLAKTQGANLTTRDTCDQVSVVAVDKLPRASAVELQVHVAGLYSRTMALIASDCDAICHSMSIKWP